MVEIRPETKWIFVIDTEQYAGNFERPMCAYCTGVVGECEVGAEEADLYREEVDHDLFNDGMALEQRPDDSDHPCRRPCAIWPTPRWFNNGRGGHFRDDPAEEADALAHWILNVVADEEQQIAQVERNRSLPTAERQRLGWTDKAIARHIRDGRAAIKKARATTNVQHYPAYLSVAIFFYDRPGPEQIALIKSRAAKFVETRKTAEKDWDRQDIKITGFRLIEERTTFTETQV